MDSWTKGIRQRNGEIGSNWTNTTGPDGERVADSEHSERGAEHKIDREAYGRDGSGWCGSNGGMGDGIEPGLEGFSGHGDRGSEPGWIETIANGSTSQTGHWDNSRPVQCSDGKIRRIPAQSDVFALDDGVLDILGALRDSGITPEQENEIIESLNCFPLAGRITGRVGLLRGAGNAIVQEVAAAFLRAVIGEICT